MKSKSLVLSAVVSILTVAARGDTLAWFRFEELTDSGTSQAVGTKFVDSSGNGRELVVEDFGRDKVKAKSGTIVSQTSVAPLSAEGNAEVVRSSAASATELSNAHAVQTKGGRTTTAESIGTVFRVAETSATRLLANEMTIEFFWNAGGVSLSGYKSFFNRSCGYYVVYDESISRYKETTNPPSPAGLELCLNGGNTIKLEYTYDNNGSPSAVQSKSTGVAIPTDSDWHHFAVTFTATEIKFYLDHALKCTQALTGPLYFGDATEAPTKKWTFGGGFTGWCMPGKFDEIRISEGALEPSEFLCFGPMGTKTTTWKGLSGPGGVVDWNDAGSWSGGVPVGTDTAIIVPIETEKSGHTYRMNSIFRMTPSADFAGTISIKNSGDPIGAPSNCALPLNVALTVLDGAQWTVEGDAVLIATPGVDARVSTDKFTGVIDVPAGVSFTVPATLDPAVRFIGSGELVLSDSAMFDRCALFSGSIRFNGTSFTVSQFAQLVGGNFTLNNGQTLSVSPQTVALGGVRAMAPLTDDGAWDFSGVTWHAGPEQKPFPSEFPLYEGDDLVLTDSPAQHRIVTYKERKFKLSDTWHLEFTVVPDASDVWLPGSWGVRPSGMVGVFFAPEKPTSVPRQMLPANANDGIYGGYLYFNRKDNAQGFRWKHTWLSQPGISTWTYGSDEAKFPESGVANDVYLESQMDGIDLRLPIDVAVSCEKGVVSFAFKQNGKSFSVIRDYSALLKVTTEVLGVYQPLKEETGYTLMIAGSTDFCPASTSQTKPWQKQTIRNFRGWWWNRYESPWQDKSVDGFSTIDGTNWKLSTYDGSVSPVLKDAEELDRCTETGGYRMLKRHNNQVTSLHSRNVVSASEPVLVTFDYIIGDCLVDNNSWKYGCSLTVGFSAHDCDHADAKMTGYTWQPCQLASGSWQNLPSWIMEWRFGTQLQYGFIAGNVGSDWNAKWTTDDVKNYHCWHITAHISLLYDGVGNMYYRYHRPPTVTSSGHQAHSPDGSNTWNAVATGYDGEYAHTPNASLFNTFKTQHANGMHLDIRAANTQSAGWNESWIENLKVRKLSSAISKAEIPSVTIAANASATLNGGAAKVGLLNLGKGATLTMNGGAVAKLSAVGASLAGTPDLAGPLTVVVPSALAAERGVWHETVDLSAVTTMRPDPENVTVVDESGNVLADVQVKIRGGKLCVLFGNVGFGIIVR